MIAKDPLFHVLDLTQLIGIPAFDYTLYDQNCAFEWKSWLGSFEWYLKANHIEDDHDKFAKLMHLAGRKVQVLYNTLDGAGSVTVVNGPLSNGLVPHLTEYESAIAKLNEAFSPRRNATYERHVLRQIQQEKHEKFGIFLMRLRKQAERCGFGGNVDENVKDQIIEKCWSLKLRRDLLKLGDVDLNKIIKVANAFEAVSEQEKDFGKNVLKSHLSFDDVCTVGTSSKYIKSDECTRCGFTGHKPFEDKCPAKGKRCNTCGGRDHFSRKCHTKKVENLMGSIKKRPATERLQPNIKKFKSDEETNYVVESDEYEF